MQLELFADPHEEAVNRVIDAALHHVENQHVLRQLLAGVPWPKAFGIGGASSRDGFWQGNAKGIEWNGQIIRPERILQRAKEYSEKG